MCACHLHWHFLVRMLGPHARGHSSDTDEHCTVMQNLLYMTRLGLWGPSTAFPNRLDFVKLLNARGVGAARC